MIDLVKEISQIPCVNGSEHGFARFLKRYFEEKGFQVSVFPGNHVLVQLTDSAPKTIVFTPMDSPGFVCLYRENDCSYLTPTSKSVEEIKDLKAVFDTDGNEHPIEESKYDKKSFCIKNKVFPLGSAFSVASPIQTSDSVIIGRFCARFACIAVVMKLAESLKNQNVGICFTAGFCSKTKAESNVMNRLQAENALLLNFAEDEDSHPILILKDGKRFSSKAFLESIATFFENNCIPFRTRVYDNPITSAESLFSNSAKNIISFAFPCKEALSEKGEVCLSSMNETFHALSEFFNSETL